MSSRQSRNRKSANESGPSVQAWVLPYLIAWVERQGLDTTSIRRLPGLTDLSDPDLRVPETSVESAWRMAANVSRNEAIGLHVAESLPRGALDLVEYSFRSSASLSAGLARLAQYSRILSDRVSARLERHGNRFLLLVRDIGNTPLHPGRAEFALATALKFAREGAGEEITPLQVSFVHPAPASQSEHQRLFRIPVRFGTGSNLLILSAEDAARPLSGVDEALSSIIHRRLDKIMAELQVHGSGPFSERVRQLMVEHLGEIPLTPSLVARTIAVSTRTLSRRLAEEGTSFRKIVDDVRREFGCALLQDRSLSIADVAFFLRYSEPAAFNRSFRRWTGQTPREFRDSA